FKLQPRSMAALKTNGLPETLIARLKPLEGKTYTTEQEYLRALDEAVGHENLETNKERFLKYAALPNNGGGPDTLAQVLSRKAHTTPAETARQSYAAIRTLLIERQEPDGSWQTQGQSPSLKWSGKNEMHEATTMWSILALSATNLTDNAQVRSRKRALES